LRCITEERWKYRIRMQEAVEEIQEQEEIQAQTQVTAIPIAAVRHQAVLHQVVRHRVAPIAETLIQTIIIPVAEIREAVAPAITQEVLTREMVEVREV